MDTKKIKAAFNTFLDTKVATLNRNHKIGICAAVVAVPVVAFYFLFFTGKTEEIKGLEGNIAQLNQELQVVRVKAAKLDEQKALMKELELKFKAASIVIPDTKEIPSLLTNISSEGTGAGLDIISFVPGGESPQEFYATIPVSLSVKGTYHNVGHFLDTVSKLPRIVNVNNIGLGAPQVLDSEVLLSVALKLETYKFIEPSTEKKKSK